MKRTVTHDDQWKYRNLVRLLWKLGITDKIVLPRYNATNLVWATLKADLDVEFT